MQITKQANIVFELSLIFDIKRNINKKPSITAKEINAKNFIFNKYYNNSLIY